MPRVFIADDDKNNFLLVKLTLEPLGVECRYFPNGLTLVDAVEGGEEPDLIILDILMPQMDGLEATKRLRASKKTRHIPIILLTGLNQIEDKVKGLEAGADDFISKPFHPLELRARVRSMLRIKQMHDELQMKNRLLEDERVHLAQLVDERTRELEELTLGIVAAFERANSYNDLDTGKHIRRVIEYSATLATAMKLPSEFVMKIRRYAGLHDVGKVVVPDRILKKNSALTPEEFEEMKRHTLYGYELLKLVNADPVAQNIALCHHERWDGKGYPKGLKGEEIPLEARIVALADVYDALTTQRVYKAAIDLETSANLIVLDRGKRFDPKVVDTFIQVRSDFESIWLRYSEEDAEPESGTLKESVGFKEQAAD